MAAEVGILEFFLALGCVASNMNGEACSKTWSVYHDQNKELVTMEKNFNKYYIDPLPDDLKFVGGTAYTLKSKELKFPIYSGVMIDIKDEGRAGLSFRKDF